jgi:hypothetical protein
MDTPQQPTPDAIKKCGTYSPMPAEIDAWNEALAKLFQPLRTQETDEKK